MAEKQKSNLLMNQAATVTWLEMPNSFPPGVKMVGDSRSRDFESVRNALRFVMEELKPASRQTAIVHTDGPPPMQIEVIRQMYAEITST